jgi:hypothetical protein
VGKCEVLMDAPFPTDLTVMEIMLTADRARHDRYFLSVHPLGLAELHVKAASQGAISYAANTIAA